MAKVPRGLPASKTGRKTVCFDKVRIFRESTYAAAWTGDNVASEEHMLAGVRLV